MNQTANVLKDLKLGKPVAKKKIEQFVDEVRRLSARAKELQKAFDDIQEGLRGAGKGLVGGAKEEDNVITQPTFLIALEKEINEARTELRKRGYYV
ncbi:MAG TPA: hypothetical protein ENN55_00620 [Firmicutes bacterium]|nr:hypothetical protein [Bacillota bacterium]